MPTHKIVFLFDVDNTLLDNDRVTTGLADGARLCATHQPQHVASEKRWIIPTATLHPPAATGLADTVALRNFSNPPLPFAIMAGGVQDRRNNYGAFGLVYFIDNAIWKAVGITPVDVLGGMSAATKLWIIGQRFPNMDDFFDKFDPKCGLACLIPRGGFGYISFDFGAEFDTPFLFAKTGAQAGLHFLQRHGSAGILVMFG